MLASPALAIGRYDVDAQSCADVHRILARDRQAILRYTPRDGRLTLYDRYVSSAVECGPGRYALRVQIPAADGSCSVLICRPVTDFTR
ncbi:hypothetical protein FJ934_25680 [Mesorhizobium sp. B2-4-12]|nr:hypothetical protein FJ934_25680 [Mesorhizobium sp. B2-4-12]